jgi:WD40 repeat protein
VKLWNFSSGNHIQTYTSKEPAEIIDISWAKEGPNTFIVGLSYEKIYIWPDNKKHIVETCAILQDTSSQGHIEDISCISHFRPGSFATGGDDGFIVFWKIQDTAAKSASSRRNRMFDTTHDAEQQKQHSHGASGSSKAAKQARVASGKAGRDEGGSSGGVPGSKRTTLPNVPPPVNTDLSPPGTVDSPGVSPSHLADAETWPQELSYFEHECSSSHGLAGVRKMIHLEHKDCLLTAHTDSFLRVWSTRKAEFLQRLELVAPAPSSPLAASEANSFPGFNRDGYSPAGRDKTTEKDRAISTVTDRDRSSSSATDAAVLDSCQEDVQIRPKITALHADTAENKWLFTGDEKGYVQLWDLTPFNPNSGTLCRHLLRLQEFQPHWMAVTHLQHFVLDGQTIVMTASADWSVTLCNIDGVRVGTFHGKGPHWDLSRGIASWCSDEPILEECPRAPDEDDGWGLSPRRLGRGGAAQNSSAVGGPPGMRGGQRSGMSRAGVAQQASAKSALRKKGFFAMLSRRDVDSNIIHQENQFLNKPWTEGVRRG